MNNKQIEAGLLINEWQLGSQLNIAVTNGTRNKFNLLLSLLSNDARDFSQFELPNATQNALTQVELRESLALSPSQPLVNKGISLQQAKALNIAAHKKDLSDIRLRCLLNNEAILSRVNDDDFDAEVVDNLSFLSQTRLQNAQQENKDSNATLAKGIDASLMEQYKNLDLENRPVKLNYA